MEYIITTNALCKDYGQFKALNNLSMHIPKGSIYGLVGKNGAGKTTLIRILCGLQYPTSGDFKLYGVDNNSKEIIKARRRMGAVVESPAIYLDMTAEENIKAQYGALGIKDKNGIKELLKLVDLENTGKKKARNFSLGMRQRLGIAMALAGNPDFLILDEPTNGLDPQGIIEMRELILKLNQEHHITVLISSHILDELSRLATYYGFVDGGRVVKEISAQDLDVTFRQSMDVEVTDLNILTGVLDDMKAEYEIVSEQKVKIYNKVNITKLVLALADKNCEVTRIHQEEESLESYFINLVGGPHHE